MQPPAPSNSLQSTSNAYLSAASISTALASRLSAPFGGLVHSVGIARHSEGLSKASEAANALPNQLDMMFFLNGKVFSAATGIAFHMTEPIYRLVVPQRAFTKMPDSQGSNHPLEHEEGGASPPLSSASGQAVGMLAPQRLARTAGRYVYQVGSHVVFEPPTSLCSCAAFKFQVTNKHDIRSCKHIVALQMALRLDAELHTPSSAATTDDTDALSAGRAESTMAPDPPVRWTNIRERIISADEFVTLVTSPHY